MILDADDFPVVYLVITEDRHRDVAVDVFSDKEEAIEFAVNVVKDCGGIDRDHVDDTFSDPDCLYYGVYSCEGDSVRVMETQIDLALMEDD